MDEVLTYLNYLKCLASFTFIHMMEGRPQALRVGFVSFSFSGTYPWG